MPVRQPKNPSISEYQRERTQEFRDAHLDNLDRALDEMDLEISEEARKSIQRIKDSDYNPSVIKRETRRIAALNSDRITRHVAEQISMAATTAQRVDRIINAYSIHLRLSQLGLDPEGMPEYVTYSDVRKARELSSRSARAAMLRVDRAPLRTKKEQQKVLQEYGPARAKAFKLPADPTQGERLLAQAIKDGRIRTGEEIGLSERLHRSARDAAREMRIGIDTAIREGETLDKAGRDLIRRLKRAGVELGEGQQLPKILQRLQKAGARYARATAGGTPVELAESRAAWNRMYAQVERYAAKLADRRGGYQELLQILDQHRVENMDKALRRWFDERQRSNAERILRTETSKAYRLLDIEDREKNPQIEGAWWRLNVTKRRAYVARRKRKRGKKGKRGGRGCVCDTLAGEFFSLATIKDMGGYMGHPNCLCFWEWKWRDTRGQPVTEEDMEWFRSLPA